MERTDTEKQLVMLGAMLFPFIVMALIGVVFGFFNFVNISVLEYRIEHEVGFAEKWDKAVACAQQATTTDAMEYCDAKINP